MIAGRSGPLLNQTLNLGPKKASWSVFTVLTRATTHRFSALKLRFVAFEKSWNGRNTFSVLDAKRNAAGQILISRTGQSVSIYKVFTSYRALNLVPV
jgi:hypothetical protein